MSESYYSLFNKQVEEFFKNIIEGFPSSSDYETIKKEFKSLKGGFSMLKNLDEKKPQYIFKEYIVNEYRDKIMNKDESFFLDKKYDITSSQKEYWVDFIRNIKNVWVTMNDESKENMWKYFKILVLLSDKCEQKQ